MDYLEDEERNDSLVGLSHQLPSSLGVRGGPSMRHFNSLMKVHAKSCISMYYDSLTMYLYSISIHVHVIAPRGGTLSYSLHGLLWAIISDEDGHSLEYIGEMISYSGCAQFSPHIIHILQACERIGETRKW